VIVAISVTVAMNVVAAEQNNHSIKLNKGVRGGVMKEIRGK